MGIFSFLGVLSPVHMTSVKLFTRTKFVGKDQAGNKYYQAKPRKGYKRDRRWVIYKGTPEATKIPPEWHNMTGTKEAYRPPGHLLESGQRDKATGDYEAWSPPE